ncbi:unnamed protein product [Bemisia tabaci]|uniref:Ionotropic receptor n=1 Tax=Bemisia tabaci TaxID=7038 RepID=A0A9P0F2Z7_BEMTA|nr:unnamed protein product [Bemisia tabaci]
MRVFNIVLITFYLSCGARVDGLALRNQSTDESLLIQVCEYTLNHANLRLSYIINLGHDSCCTQLVQYLHKNAITTIIASLEDTSLYATNELSKNMVFIVNDCSDIVNFILGSMVSFWDSDKNFTNHLYEYPPSRNNVTSRGGFYQRSAFPNFCILNDAKTGASVRDFSRPCDVTIKMTLQDIADGSILKGKLLDFTGEAYNQVWNPDNYLIFVVSPRVEDDESKMRRQPPTCNLFFIFRLIWRIFKGRKTMICFPVECYWYDSFFNKTHVFTGSQGEEFFEFEWPSMNRKNFHYYTDIYNYNDDQQQVQLRSGYLQWEAPVHTAIKVLGQKRTGTIQQTPVTPGDLAMTEQKFAIKYDMVILLIDASSRLRSTNYENYDHLAVTDTGSLCFHIPRSGFKPQYLTVFKCFSQKVWVCFLATIATFLLMHHFHKSFQSQHLAHLYSEYELVQYESLSTALTIYRYFLCVAQPRLLLGKLRSGKILFGTFVFAALILTTLLQSGMVTFLNTRIRYADINTLEHLAASDMLVQSPNLRLDEDFCGREEQLHWLQKRLVGSFHYSYNVYMSEIQYVVNSSFSNVSDCEICDRLEQFEEFTVAGLSAMKNLEASMTSDAFMGITSAQLSRRNWGFMEFRRIFEYHTTRECLASYPLMYFMPRHMFARDDLNDVLSRSFEVGLVDKEYEEIRYFTLMLQIEVKEEVVMRRPFSMRDLRIAFICLGAGYLVCQNTLNHAKLSLSYIVNLSRDTCCTQLSQYLHNNGISTISVSFVDTTRYATNDLNKNMVFIFNDCSDIVNFILGSMNSYWDFDQSFTEHLIEHSVTRDLVFNPKIPNICVVYDDETGATVRDFKRPCDATIQVALKDIADGSIIENKQLLNFTASAYNQIWNPDNYLIFVVLPHANDTNPSGEWTSNCNLFFTFRLIWRIFKGRKTVICSLKECFWYDAFLNETHVYKGSRGEEYFDFSWASKNKKNLNYYVLESGGGGDLLEYRTGYDLWQFPVYSSLGFFCEQRAVALRPPTMMPIDELEMNEREIVVKYDLALLFLDALYRLRSKIDHNYDFTIVTDFGSFCFFVPRKGFKPQYLTVFKCFSPKVWVCFLVTIGTFLLLHHFHKLFQLQRMARLYSEYDLIQYESLSTALTVYRYFLCVSQPRLLLGKLPSRKILFGTFVFAALVLTTLLQSGMVTFLSKRVRYTDIDTIQQLAESDLLIQSSNLAVDSEFFGREEQFEWIQDRFVYTYASVLM